MSTFLDKMTKFRQVFDFSKLSKELYRWFPGHMTKGLRQIHEQLPYVDAVIEVHDARVFTSFLDVVLFFKNNNFNCFFDYFMLHSLEEISHFVKELLVISRMLTC
jgi:hypothetical protein